MGKVKALSKDLWDLLRAPDGKLSVTRFGQNVSLFVSSIYLLIHPGADTFGIYMAAWTGTAVFNKWRETPPSTSPVTHEVTK